jgi:hypothetical protein
MRKKNLTIAEERIPKGVLKIGELLLPERDYWRPRTREECKYIPRPCPYVMCRWHLYLDVNPNGSITLNWPGYAPWDIPNCGCALDLAEQNGEQGMTLEAIGIELNITRERVRQIEQRALLKSLRAFAGRTSTKDEYLERVRALAESSGFRRDNLPLGHTTERSPEPPAVPADELADGVRRRRNAV